MDINVTSRGGARGMTYFDRPISREIYERAKTNGGRLTRELCKVQAEENARLRELVQMQREQLHEMGGRC